MATESHTRLIVITTELTTILNAINKANLENSGEYAKLLKRANKLQNDIIQTNKKFLIG